jgi:hypothetical protein
MVVSTRGSTEETIHPYWASEASGAGPEPMIDVNEIRGATIALHGLTGCDLPYLLHYDETNNVRRLLVTPSGLNVGEPEPFVLGGIARRLPCDGLDYPGLRSLLRIQKTTKELKLAHLGKGDFPQILGSEKVELFLGWILDHGLSVHYSVIDPLYWSIVDIIDSIMAAQRDGGLIVIAVQLKDDLYRVLRQDIKGTVDLFRHYSYPNVGRQQSIGFAGELLQILEDNRDILADFNFQMLKGVLQLARSLESLPFLEDEKPNVLIDEFSHFYIDRICLFKNSEHVLDTEETVKARLKGQAFVDGERVLQNYRFVDSQNDPGVQISDVVVGLLGKCFGYLIRTEQAELLAARAGLSPAQRASLDKLARLLDRSTDENPAFAHYTLSLEDRERAAMFLSP